VSAIPPPELLRERQNLPAVRSGWQVSFLFLLLLMLLLLIDVPR
jgi:hypothetical protein